MRTTGWLASVALLVTVVCLGLWLPDSSRSGPAPPSPPPGSAVPDGARSTAAVTVESPVTSSETVVRAPAEAPSRAGLWGVVSRGHAPVAGRDVVVRGEAASGKGVDRTTVTGPDGTYRFELAAGRYTVHVPLPASARQSPYAGLVKRHRKLFRSLPRFLAHHTVDLGGAPCRRDFDLPRGRIEVLVTEDGSSACIAGAELTIRPRDQAWPWIHEVESDATGRARVEDLPFGQWTSSGLAAYHVATSDVTVTLSEREPVALVTLRLEPRSTLAVSLIDDSGGKVKISAALRLSVRNLDTGAALTPTNGAGFAGTRRPLELLYERVPAGRYRVALEDELAESRDGATLRFQPIDAVSSQEVVLSPGRRTEATLRTRYRAYVRLRGTRPDGAFDPSLRMRVHPLDERYGRVRVLPGPWQRGEHQGGVHFDGYLEPGAYSVTLTGEDGRRRTERLTVGREPIDRAFEIPGGK